MKSISKNRKTAIGFIPKYFADLSLPHRDTGNYRYVRVNGSYCLNLYADEKIGLPFGVIPRLLLIWMSTETVKRKTPVLNIDHTLSSFLKSLGIASTGLNIKRFKEQARRLFFCSIKVTTTGDKALDYDFVAHLEPAMTAIFPKKGITHPVITLHEAFHLNAINSAVPLDMCAIRQLKNSSLGIDIYIWLTSRMHDLSEPVSISWRQLQNQFGSNYAKNKTGTQSFKRAFDTQIKKIIEIYPSVKIQKSEHGITLEPSPTHVSKRYTKPVDKSCG